MNRKRKTSSGSLGGYDDLENPSCWDMVIRSVGGYLVCDTYPVSLEFWGYLVTWDGKIEDVDLVVRCCSINFDA